MDEQWQQRRTLAVVKDTKKTMHAKLNRGMDLWGGHKVGAWPPCCGESSSDVSLPWPVARRSSAGRQHDSEHVHALSPGPVGGLDLMGQCYWLFRDLPPASFWGAFGWLVGPLERRRLRKIFGDGCFE